MENTRKRKFWYLTFSDTLTILCAAAVPVALGIYTVITYKQEKEHVEKTQQFSMEQAIGSRQDTIFDKFLNNVYDLDKDDYLNENKTPWAFANAYYRAAHRQLDAERKGDVLLFLKEKELIGRNNCTQECGSKSLTDIIRLNELSFDHVYIKSQTRGFKQVKLDCIVFDQVSMINATFLSANLHGASFDHARLNNAKFYDSNLSCASFNDTQLHGTDFGNSNLKDAQFSYCDLSGAKLTDDQYKQASFDNTILPNGTRVGAITSITTTRKSSMATTTTTPTEITSEYCAPSYSQTPSGKCVNIQTDFNNCGTIGYVCSSNYTNCTDGKCTKPPILQLVNGATIFNDINSLDDRSKTIDLPINIEMYNYSTSTVTVTINGVVCLGGCSIQHRNSELPNSNFSGPTAFPYWDDLYIKEQTSQNVYWAVSGMIPNQTTTFEFITTHFAQYNEYYHFQIMFYENLPNPVKYKYFEASDGGVSATIGVQNSSVGPNITYSVNQKNSVKSNMTLTFDTNTGKFTVE